MEFLEQAEIIAQDLNMESSIEKVSRERELMDNEINKWRTLSKDNGNLLERIDRLKFKEYINEALEFINLSDGVK